MRTFLMKTGQMEKPVQCYIVRDRSSTKMYPKYNLYLNDNDRFMLSARKRKKVSRFWVASLKGRIAGCAFLHATLVTETRSLHCFAESLLRYCSLRSVGTVQDQQLPHQPGRGRHLEEQWQLFWQAEIELPGDGIHCV